DGVSQRGVFVQATAHLVKVANVQFGAMAYDAGIGLLQTQHDAQQGGLACTVVADQTDAVATHQHGREVLDQDAVVVAVRDILQLCYQLAGALAFGNGEFDVARALASLGTVTAQLFQAPYTAFVARATRLYAFAYPDFFLGQKLVELGVLLLFRFQEFRFAFLPLTEVAGETEELAAVQLDNAGGDHIQESTVVGNDDGTAAKIQQQLFQPENAV